eukprot:Nk52_evm1s1809 gene=Nk52_evmTU1s1809
MQPHYLESGMAMNHSREFSASASRRKSLNLGTINRQLLSAEYAVRGELAIKAEALSEQLKTAPDSLPFKEITRCNIGNPQELNQKPISFIRQVCSLVDNPDLLHESKREWLKQEYPVDVIERACKIHKAIKSTGSYSHSQGIKMIREDVAKFIENRDGCPADPNDIFLSNGASTAVQMSLQAVIQGRNCGVMIPIPQYPLYTATLAMVDGTPVPYYLNEEDKWGLSVEELTASLKKAKQFDIDTRALVVINPGNPTGQCLSKTNMEEIIDFCKQNKIMLLADEVYQTNIYDPENYPFHSFKKVLKSMGSGYQDVELISFHSTSKGFIGECGKRGGYMELCGILPEVHDQFYKAASICLCPNVMGQIVVDCMVNPPKEGEPSYELYHKETTGIFESLKRRAEILVKAFNEMEGVSCAYSNGAMYAFPQVRLPQKAIEAARAAGKAPDTFYCLAMLEETGVCVVSGTGFHQKENTWHFRSTFLPPEDTFSTFTKSIGEFHKKFMDKYR